MPNQHIEHITLSNLYPKSNKFIKWQVKTIKAVLATAWSSGMTLDTLLLNLQWTPIGLHMPSPRDILHNWAQEHLGQPSQPVNFKEICKYLISKKALQKENHSKLHNTRSLPELHPGQGVLFLSPNSPNTYIQDIITSPASAPRRTKQHICPLNCDTYLSPISGPFITQISAADPDKSTAETTPSLIQRPQN